ncbi:hypothetical protein FACS1894132_01310 [Clostridia bacterium]|nr:hypothetical protein FACS1894132_01310 [Clostridia bacterium]
MTVYNNIDTIGAAFDAMGSLANSVAGLKEINPKDYSNKAKDMGAGRFDSLELSPEYQNAIASGYDPNWQNSGQYDTATALMQVASGSSGNANITPETMTAMNVIDFFQEANTAMLDTALKMIEDTVAGLHGINTYNRAAEWFE